MNRAFSLIQIKSFNEGERLVEGIATSAVPDRVDDVVEPKGGTFKLPLPLLLDHRHDAQVGHVETAKVTANGIHFRARIAKVEEPGPVKDLCDQAWQLVRHRLRAAVSIGFRALKDGAERLPTGGTRFRAWEWIELSLVSIPANAEAAILSVKKIDATALAALKAIDTGYVPPAPKPHRTVYLNPPKKVTPPPWGMKVFLAKRDVANLDPAALRAEAARFEAEAKRLEYEAIYDMPATGKALTRDAKALVAMAERIEFGFDAIAAWEDDQGASIAKYAGAIWVRTHKDSDYSKPPSAAHGWIVVQGTPQPVAEATKAPAKTLGRGTWEIDPQVVFEGYPVGARKAGNRELIEERHQQLFDSLVVHVSTRMKAAGYGPLDSVPILSFAEAMALIIRDRKWTGERFGEAEDRLAALEAAAGLTKDATPTPPEPQRVRREKTTVTRHDEAGRVLEFIRETVPDDPVSQKIAALEDRTGKLEAEPKLAYRGVWLMKETYQPGAVVTYDGSSWVAKIESKGIRPGDGTAWQLAVKRGRDGKDATK